MSVVAEVLPLLEQYAAENFDGENIDTSSLDAVHRTMPVASGEMTDLIGADVDALCSDLAALYPGADETMLDEPDGIRAYIHKANKIPKLSREEEYEVAVRAKAGDKHALKRLVSSNLMLVVYRAHKFWGKTNLMDFAERVGYGNVALCEAAIHFDPEYMTEHGERVRFTTYAVGVIDNKFRRALAQHDRSASVTLRAGEVIMRMRATAWDLRRTTGVRPTLEAIASAMNVTEQELIELAEADDMVADVSRRTNVPETVVPPADAEKSRRVTGLLQSLTAKQREVIELRFGFNGQECTVQEAAKELGQAQSTTYHRYNTAMKKLATHAVELGLDPTRS